MTILIGVGARSIETPISRTPPEHVNAIREMCERLVGEEVELACVDDWGYFSNFVLYVRPRRADRHTTRRLRALVRKALPEGAHIRSITPPRQGCTRTTIGRCGDWCVDIDFHWHDQQSNTFVRKALDQGSIDSNGESEMNEATEQFCIVDTETTGTGAGDTPVEVALVRVHDGAQFSSLVNPGRSIPPESSAVHGITDEDIEAAAAPHLAELEEELRAFVGNAILVAHNADFDRGMLPMFERQRWLCTMRLAKHAFPQAPNFKNATLRYWRKLKIAAPEGLQMHRALYDAIVTTALFADLRTECARLFGAVSGSQLLELARQPALVRTMPFGKHFGEPIDQIPSGYLKWLLEKCDNVDDDLRYTVKQALVAAR